MTTHLLNRQALFDRLNLALQNFKQAQRDRERAQEQEHYWRKQMEIVNKEIEATEK